MTLAPQMVDLWLDDDRTGSGLRPYLVLSIGPKYATLFNPGLLTEIKIDRALFDRKAKPRVEFDARKVHAIIKRNAAEFRRLGIRHSGSAAQEALALLKGIQS